MKLCTPHGLAHLHFYTLHAVDCACITLSLYMCSVYTYKVLDFRHGILMQSLCYWYYSGCTYYAPDSHNIVLLFFNSFCPQVNSVMSEMAFLRLTTVMLLVSSGLLWTPGIDSSSGMGLWKSRYPFEILPVYLTHFHVLHWVKQDPVFIILLNF